MAFNPSGTDSATGIESPVLDTDLNNTSRAISVSGEGTVNAVFIDDSTGDFFCLAGVDYPRKLKRILSAGTTATGIRSFY